MLIGYLLWVHGPRTIDVIGLSPVMQIWRDLELFGGVGIYGLNWTAMGFICIAFYNCEGLIDCCGVG